MKNLTIRFTAPKNGRADVVCGIEEATGKRVTAENLGNDGCEIRVSGISDDAVQDLRNALPDNAKVIDSTEAA